MNGPPNALPPLVDLLGTRWRLDAPVVAVAWARRGGRAAFAFGDGTVAFGGPFVVRAGQPPRGPRELNRIPAHDGACLALAADGEGGFLSAGDDGRLLGIVPPAAPVELANQPGEWLDHVAVGARGIHACASGRRLWIRGPDFEDVLTLASGVTALAFDPAGRTLAIAGHGGVELWSAADRSRRRLEAPGYHRALAWSPDGRFLASGLQENAVCCWRLGDGRRFVFDGYPGQPRALSFAARGHTLATSGGPRVVAWDLDRPRPADSRIEFGYPGRVPVSAVAWHPGRGMVAAGYHNGAVLLCRPGSDQHLFVQGSGSGPVTALAWAADGSGLALGTQQGELAMVAIPPEILSMARAA
ncbi:hypothetical protein CJ010_07445 [Azoarcus sp. DD4]|uniref:WD40 repeat domain-containing protein n=1 Tax=Azoarcus sp. DD4 TaxID=2027405 RepID=UPI00112A9B2D|nr:WD40 repeat domain-containing protein [Azoarcus sp. DD4]QDF96385.1 hypothetical protein CJ010_07445 [Azoarcus sp. DD4]